MPNINTMTIFKSIKNFFFPPKTPTIADMIKRVAEKEHYDENSNELIDEVWKTGKPMIGWYDAEGNWHMKSLDGK